MSSSFYSKLCEHKQPKKTYGTDVKAVTVQQILKQPFNIPDLDVDGEGVEQTA